MPRDNVADQLRRVRAENAQLKEANQRLEAKCAKLLQGLNEWKGRCDEIISRPIVIHVELPPAAQTPARLPGCASDGSRGVPVVSEAWAGSAPLQGSTALPTPPDPQHQLFHPAPG